MIKINLVWLSLQTYKMIKYTGKAASPPIRRINGYNNAISSNVLTIQINEPIQIVMSKSPRRLKNRKIFK